MSLTTVPAWLAAIDRAAMAPSDRALAIVFALALAALALIENVAADIADNDRPPSDR